MISVKDKDVEMRRSAFLQTIQYHKSQASKHSNAVFSSTSGRFGKNTNTIESKEGDHNYKTATDAFGKSTNNSTFGLTFQKGGSSGLVPHMGMTSF